MKIIKDNWLDYKEGKRGSQVVALFEKAVSPEFTVEEQLGLIKEFNAQRFMGDGDDVQINLINMFDQTLFEITDGGNVIPTSQDESSEFFKNLILKDLPSKCNVDEKYAATAILPILDLLSIALYNYIPGLFYPYLFTLSFHRLKAIAEKFEIDLPEVPKKSDYESRCMYYIELCKIFNNFRLENDWSAPEMCAFLYDYAQRSNPTDRPAIPEPANAWFVGGVTGSSEANLTTRFWQAHPDVRRGDILIHYEGSPISAVTGLWIAQEDAIIDPFFYYYSFTVQGNHVELPAIKQQEFKEDSYFKNHALVRKNFQGVSRWPMSAQDYKELIRILNSKGYNTSTLPQLYAPQLIEGVEIIHEKDVTDKYLVPMLEKMGWVKGIDFQWEVPFTAGRGSSKRPDYCLHVTQTKGEYSAKVIIEAKYYMKNGQDIEKAFKQCKSYGKWGNAQTLVLIDKYQILVFNKHNGTFDSSKYDLFYWSDVINGNADKYNALKKLLS
jgi:hypothetical protein